MAEEFNLLDGIQTSEEAILDDEGRYSQIDADTYYDKEEGKSLRLQGLQARETAHLVRDENSPIPVSFGEIGGTEQSQEFHKLAKKHGYTNAKELGSVGAYNRQEAELTTDAGEFYSNRVLSEGLFKPTAHTTVEGVQNFEIGNLFRSTQADKYEDTDWGQARRTIDEAIAQGGPTEFKTNLIDEQAIQEWQSMIDLDPNVNDYFNTSSVQQRTKGRYLNNKAHNQLSEAWDVGLISTVESMYGVIDWLGDVVDNKTLQDVGQAGVSRAKLRTAEKAAFITSHTEVEGISDLISYVANNAAMSVPYMGASILGAGVAAVASPALGVIGAGAAGLALPSLLYTGNTYNEMEGDKNAGVAAASGIAQAALDRLGLGFIFKGVGGKATGDVIEAAVKHLVKTGIPRKEAIKQIGASTRTVIAEFAGGALKVAKSQASARNFARQLIHRGSKGAAGEGITEALQEGTAYLSATYGSDKVFNADEFNERIIQAAVAGGALGKTFALPGVVTNTAAWKDVAYKSDVENLAHTSWAGKHARADEARQGHQTNLQESNSQTTAPANAAKDNVLDLNSRVKANEATKEARSDRAWLKDKIKAIPGLFNSMANHTFKKEWQDLSPKLRVVAEKYGANRQRSTSGSTFESREHHIVSAFKNVVSRPIEILGAFGRKSQSKKNRQSFSTEFYETYNAAKKKADAQGRDVDFDTDLDGTPMAHQKAEYRALQHQLDNLSADMRAKQMAHNPNLGLTKNYLNRYKSFNKKAVHGNRTGFIQALTSQYGMNIDDAIELTDSIIHNEQVNTIDDFSVTSNKNFLPTSHKARNLHLSENAGFKEFYEPDLFQNISNASKSAARYIAHQEFVGENHSKLNYELSQIEQELRDAGKSEAEAAKITNEIAGEMKDYLDMASGNYKRIKSPMIKWVQSNVIFATTVTSLPLATVSNFVELMMVYRGLDADQIKKTIVPTVNEFVTEVKDIASGIASATELHQRKEQLSGGRGIVKDLGYLEYEVGAATTTGVTEAGALKNEVLDKYFKFIGLQQWTNFTRSARASIAGDYIGAKLDVIEAYGYDNDALTGGVAEAYEALRNLGIDPKRVNMIRNKIDAGTELTPEEVTLNQDMMRNAIFNFINDAVALPQTANRPKIYSDPRFAMFTQFQGFISTVTANHIPKLWGEYILRGSPGMRYNAFALIMTTIFMGFMAQAMKDAIKGNEDELETLDWLRRGVGASGQLGTYERVADFIFPIYEDRYSNPLTWAIGTAAGESAGAGKVGQLIDSAGFLIQGEGDKASKKAIKIGFGPLSSRINDALDSKWSF